MKKEKSGNKEKRFSPYKAMAVAVIGILMIFAPVVAGCAKNFNDAEPYDMTYEKPFSSATDDFMKIDGVLDEEEWQGQNKMVHSSDGITLSATTVFTQKGLYIGLEALDDNIQWYIRSAFDTNSSFEVQLVKEGEPTYDVNNGWEFHPTRNRNFSIDAKTSRSYRETPYTAASKVDGELNSGNTRSLSAEIFVTWEDMNYTQEELNENGCPDVIRMYVSYRKVIGENSGDNKDIIPSFMQKHRFDTYFKFGAQGLKTVYSSSVMGNADNGVAASDCWSIDDAAVTAETEENRTQVLWFRQGYSSDFIAETDVKIHVPSDGYYPSAGLIGLAGQDVLNVYTANGRGITDNAAGSRKILLNTARKTDGLQWLGDVRLNETVEEAYSSDTINLKIIKRGGQFYYFYNDTYWDSEYIDTLSGKVYAGLYTNDGATFTNYSFTDYSDKTLQLDEILSEYVYFVSAPGVTARGNVQSDKLAVKKGDSVTLTISPASNYFLTAITNNGADIYDDVAAGLSDGKYTFVPSADVAIAATFTPFPAEAAVDVLIPVRGTENAEPVLSAKYVITCDNRTMYYTGENNSRGNVVVTLPKAGSYEVGGRSITVSGNYAVRISAEGYHDVTASFTLNDSTVSTSIDGEEESVAEDKAFTMTVNAIKVRYGTVTVNGVKVEGSGTLLYNEETDNYYSSASNVNQYFTSAVASEYVARANISFSQMVNQGTDPVAGIGITSGAKTIVLKSCRWEENRLCIAIGDSGTTTSYEIAVTDFTHDIGESSGTLEFTVVRYDNIIYIFNSDGKLKVYLDENGVHTVNGCFVQAGADRVDSINSDLEIFFDAGDENAVGMVKYGTTGSVEWDIDFRKEGAYEAVSGGTFTFETETEDYSAKVEGLKVGDGFVLDSTVRIEIKAADPRKAVKTLKLSYNGGEDYKEIQGIYNAETLSTVFEFVYDNAYTVTVSEYTDLIAFTGTVSAPDGTDFTLVIIEAEGVGAFENKVNADGEFTVMLPEGTYNFRFSSDGLVAYLSDKAVGDGSAAEVTLVSDIYDFDNVAEVNGITVNASADSENGFAFRADAMDGNLNYLPAGRLYLLPNTVTTDDFIYTVTMTDIERFAGMGITDGEITLSFQVVSWEGGGQNLVVEADYLDCNRNTLEVEIPVSPNTKSDATYTIIKTGTTLTVCAGKGDNAVWIVRITPDSYEFNGGKIKERVLNNMTSAQRFEKQKQLLSEFLGEGKEYMAVLYRNEYTPDTKGGYEYSFEKLQTITVTGTVALPSGALGNKGKLALSSGGVEYVFDVSGEAFSIEVPEGTYDVIYKSEGASAYIFDKIVDGNSALVITATSDLYEIDSSVAINGKEYLSYCSDLDFLSLEKRADSLDGTLTLGNTAGAYGLVMPNTSTAEEYEFSVRMTADAGNSNMAGIGVTNGSYALSFQLSNGEANGKRLVIELAETWCGNDFVLYCESVSTDNVWNAATGVDATITLRRFADKLEVYVGRNTVSKVLTVTADGYVFASAGWTVNNADRLNAHNAVLSGFFGDSVSHAMVLASNYLAAALTYEYDFKFIENHELSGEINVNDGDKATLTLISERGIVYSFTGINGAFTVKVPYGKYSYAIECDGYAQKSGELDFSESNTRTEPVTLDRYSAAVDVVMKESESEIVFEWDENTVDIVDYKLVLKGETDTVLASTNDGSLTAQNGRFTFTVSKTDGNYVKNATYQVVATPISGVLLEPSPEMKAEEFGYGYINDFSSEALYQRVIVTGSGVTTSYSGGLMLSASGKAEATVKSLRTVDTGNVNFVNILVAGNGEATVAGKTVTLVSGKTEYVNLTPAEYGKGEFTVGFTDSLLIKSIATDAIDENKSSKWVDNSSEGQGAVVRNEDGSYSIFEPDIDSSRYSFTSLAMPASTTFTLSAHVKVNSSENEAKGQIGFTLSVPVYDGSASSAILWNTWSDNVIILSYKPGWNDIYIGKDSPLWLMNDGDYASLDKTDFEMTLTRDNELLYLLIDGKPLVFINTDTTPLWKVSDSDRTDIPFKDVPVAAGFGIRHRIGYNSSPVDNVTFSDYSVVLSAESDMVKLTSVEVTGAGENLSIYAGAVNPANLIRTATDGAQLNAYVPVGITAVVYDGKKALFIDETLGAENITGVMQDATYMTGSTYADQKASAQGGGTFEVPASFGQSVILPSTATVNPFEFTAYITAKDTSVTEGMQGISIQNVDTGSYISFQSANWEGQGSKVIIDVKRSTDGTNDYVLNCASPNKMIWHGEMELYFKISRTADKIVLSIGPDGKEMKILTATKDGITFADDSWTVNNSERKAANDLKLQEFFGPDVMLAAGYSSYDRQGITSVYTAHFEEKTLISASGNVMGGTGEGVVEFTALSGAMYDAAVSEGMFALNLPAGDYKAHYTDKTDFALADLVTLDEENKTVTLTAYPKTMLASSGTVNGITLNSGTLTEEEIADSRDGSFTLTDNTSNFYYMPETVTSGAYEYTVTMENVSNMAGMSLTNGKSILSFQIANWEKGGASVIVECSGLWMGNDFVLNVEGSVNSYTSATFTVRRYADSIQLYIGSGVDAIKVLTITSDGSFVLESCATPADQGRYDTCTANQKSQLAAFFGSGVQHMAGLARNNADAQSVTYTVFYTLI